MKDQNVFDNLKLRAGYGISGNAMGFNPYSSIATWGASGLFEYDGKTYRTFAATQNVGFIVFVCASTAVAVIRASIISNAVCFISVSI